MKGSIFIFLFLMVNFSQAQTKKQEPVYDLITSEEGAEFPGGGDAMKKIIKSNFKYPLTGKDLNFKIWIAVDIDANGVISNPVIKKGYTKEYNSEALRVVKKMPKWIPCKVLDKPQKCSMLIPIFSNKF